MAMVFGMYVMLWKATMEHLRFKLKTLVSVFAG